MFRYDDFSNVSSPLSLRSIEFGDDSDVVISDVSSILPDASMSVLGDTNHVMGSSFGQDVGLWSPINTRNWDSPSGGVADVAKSLIDEVVKLTRVAIGHCPFCGRYPFFEPGSG